MVPSESIPFDVVLPRSDVNYTLFVGNLVSIAGRAFPGGSPEWEEPALQPKYLSKMLPAGEVTTVERVTRERFLSAMNIVDWFALNEPEASPWRIHHALCRVNNTILGFLKGLFEDGADLLFEDGQALRRAQVLACNQPGNFFERTWEFWFMPFRNNSRVFLLDEVVHSDLITYTWDSETIEEKAARAERCDDLLQRLTDGYNTALTFLEPLDWPSMQVGRPSLPNAPSRPGGMMSMRGGRRD